MLVSVVVCMWVFTRAHPGVGKSILWVRTPSNSVYGTRLCLSTTEET